VVFFIVRAVRRPIPDRRASYRTHRGDLSVCLSIGFSENRIPLFGPML